MTHSPQQINDICDRWYMAVMQPDGSMHFTQEAEKHRLLNNGVNYHDLPFESICAAISGTTRTLLLPRLTVAQSESDHRYLWAWCGQVLFNYNILPVFPVTEHIELHRHFLLTLHAALTRAPYIGPPRDDFHHAGQLIENSAEILCHLSFPLLEAVAKHTCAQFVATDGRILRDFEINETKYKAGQNKQGHDYKCSSLRDLLELSLQRVITTNPVKHNLQVIKDHIAKISGKNDGFRALYDWRNESLHGAGTATPIGGTVLNLALLLAFSNISDSYEERRRQTFESSIHSLQRPPFDCTLYPPR